MTSIVDAGPAAKAVSAVFTHSAVRRWMQRQWFRLCRKQAMKKFQSLNRRVEGLLEQAEEGDVNAYALSALAADLETLGVVAPAINGERGKTRLREELEYLSDCTGFRFGLRMARWRFETDPLGDLSFKHEAMAAIHLEWWERFGRKRAPGPPIPGGSDGPTTHRTGRA